MILLQDASLIVKVAINFLSYSPTTSVHKCNYSWNLEVCMTMITIFCSMFSYYCHISWLQTKPTNMAHLCDSVFEERFFFNGYESDEAHSIEIKRNKKHVYVNF